jgi:hypothetical protein
MRASPCFEQNVQPAFLVARARAESRDSFVQAFADTQLLVVALDDHARELAAGLEEGDTASLARPGDGSESMSITSPPAGPRAMVAREAARRRAAVASFDHASLRARFERGPHFVVPLRKRFTAGARVSERLSIGRSRDNDIVLRHPSISKCHAGVECDLDGTLYLSDAHSKNSTRVNGVIIDPSALIALRPGDEIRFGLVVSTLCPAHVFWDAVAGAE